MEIKDIIKFILNDATASDIDSIRRTLVARKDQDAVALRCELQVGQTVWLKAGKPAYLNGAEAVVVKINRERVVIDLVKPAGKFFKGVTTPVSLLSTVKT